MHRGECANECIINAGIVKAVAVRLVETLQDVRATSTDDEVRTAYDRACRHVALMHAIINFDFGGDDSARARCSAPS